MRARVRGSIEGNWDEGFFPLKRRVSCLARDSANSSFAYANACLLIDSEKCYLNAAMLIVTVGTEESNSVRGWRS